MTMHRDLITKLFRSFEDLAHRDGELEYWFARELQELLGYTQWRNFEQVVDKAREACQNAGQAVEDHFADVSKMVDLGSGAQRQIEDIALTRYAAYLIAQNGDPKKETVAFAQTYFAVQTRKQELIETRLLEAERVRARARLVESEKELSAVIFERIGDEQSFARIRSKGDRALFGGLTTHQMKERLGVPEARALADFLPTVTIKAKDFATEMTVHNTKERDLRSEAAITEEHVENSTEVRKVMGARGIVPENLPAEEDVKKLERRLQSVQKKLPGRVRRLEVDEGGEDKP